MAKAKRLETVPNPQQAEQGRELTTLEYVILGFLGIKPHSGYDMLNTLQVGVYRASASTGSIYPVLKRLEKAGLIASVIDYVYETRPRKVYTLQAAGEAALDEWLRRPPTMAEVIEAYDVAMHKFMVAEYRLSRDEVLDWLTNYEAIIQAARAIQVTLAEATSAETTVSTHTTLLKLWILAEIDARLHWISTARRHLTESTPR